MSDGDTFDWKTAQHEPRTAYLSDLNRQTVRGEPIPCEQVIGAAVAGMRQFAFICWVDHER